MQQFRITRHNNNSVLNVLYYHIVNYEETTKHLE